MNVLAIDTTANRLELALAGDGQVIAHHVGDASSPPSRDLHVVLNTLLVDAGLRLSALDLIAVVRGPGSFTGLRVGLAAGKTFSKALDIPAIGLDSLVLLAVRAGIESCALVHAVINTYRDEVYLQTFKRIGDTCQAKDDVKLITFDRLWPLVGDEPVMMRRIPQRQALPLSCPAGVKMLDRELGQDLVLEALKIGPKQHEQADDGAITASLVPLYIKADVARQSVKGLAS